jgi:hypothetical protein
MSETSNIQRDIEQKKSDQRFWRGQLERVLGAYMPTAEQIADRLIGDNIPNKVIKVLNQRENERREFERSNIVEETEYEISRRITLELHGERKEKERQRAKFLKETLEGQVEWEIGNYVVWHGIEHNDNELIKHFGEYLKKDGIGFNEGAKKLFIYTDDCDREVVVKARKILSEKLKEIEGGKPCREVLKSWRNL